jgi:monothiol glutaredoxin
VSRAQGLTIDAVVQPNGVAFRIINPNEPASVKMMSATELKQRLDDAKKTGKTVELFDVRSEGERAMAKIEEARVYDEAARNHLQQLPKDTTLVFFCHHGGRSQRAAEEALKMGFKTVFNIQGGIDAWARDVDPTMTRY